MIFEKIGRLRCKASSIAEVGLSFADQGPCMKGKKMRRYERASIGGTAFMTHQLFAASIGALSSENSTSLFIVDIAPKIGSQREGSDIELDARAIENSWAAFDSFQRELINGFEFLVDILIFDNSKSWFVVKTMEAIFVFS